MQEANDWAVAGALMCVLLAVYIAYMNNKSGGNRYG